VKDAVEYWLDGLRGKLSTRTLQGIHAILKRSIRLAQARNVWPKWSSPGFPGRGDGAWRPVNRGRLRSSAVRRLRLAVRTGHRRHQDQEVTTHAATAAACRRGFAEAPHAAGHGQVQGRQGMARSRPGVLLTDRNAARRRERTAGVQAHHQEAGIGENWTPPELRHSFVSLLSDDGVPIETIADLCGHAGTAVTEEVCRFQLMPVLRSGAESVNSIFGSSQSA
jgi:integrase